MDLDEQDAETAQARRVRARQLRLERAVDDPDSNASDLRSGKPVLDLRGPRLRLFARSGEFPRADAVDSPKRH